MSNQLDPAAMACICNEALKAARGDDRTALAMLLGCYVQIASRAVIAEQPSGFQLEAMATFCQLASSMFRDSAGDYGRGIDADPARDPVIQGKLHDTQGEGGRFAYRMRNRLERSELTRTPKDDELSPDERDYLGDHG